MAEAEARWAQALAAWAIPDDILRRAPECPWGFPPALFTPAHEHSAARDTPSHRRAAEALPKSGTVIDVGAGAGAASLPLADIASSITAVDESRDMLGSFAAAAERRSIEHAEVEGSWPEIAPEAGRADVVVCHHVFYNAPPLGLFAAALTDAALRRVVVEITATHPASTLNELWRHFHGLERPTGPTYEDALAVLCELGLEVGVERWSRAPRRSMAPRSQVVAFVRRRLCLTPDRDDEIDRMLGASPVWSPTEVVTLWWER